MRNERTYPAITQWTRRNGRHITSRPVRLPHTLDTLSQTGHHWSVNEEENSVRYRRTPRRGLLGSLARVGGVTAAVFAAVRGSQAIESFYHKEAGTVKYWQHKAEELFRTVPDEERIQTFTIAHYLIPGSSGIPSGATIRKSPTEGVNNTIGKPQLFPKGLEIYGGILIRGDPAGPDQENQWIVFRTSQLNDPQDPKKGVLVSRIDDDAPYSFINLSNIAEKEQILKSYTSKVLRSRS